MESNGVVNGGSGGGSVGFIGLDELSLDMVASLLCSGYKVQAFEAVVAIEFDKHEQDLLEHIVLEFKEQDLLEHVVLEVKEFLNGFDVRK
ncbi:unnamed protein product [Dovyalis caffra]|uniref:Uncharacterized protein n=1 Tax=Dovyalis caffra TaxID=77055 RepID=A0AAV1SE62_9ROSI|nr:unnamed protein product [Dovyalis caffra]